MAQVQNNNQLNKNTANTAQPAVTTDEWRNQPDRAEEVMPKSKKPKISNGLAIAVVILLIIVVASFFAARRGGDKSQEGGIQPSVSTAPSAETSSPGVQVVQKVNEKNELRDYFRVVSPNNFKDEFLNWVPELAFKKYMDMSQEKDTQAKLEAAREFYILLNNPMVNRNDPQAINWIVDVRSDIERQLGKPLF